MSSDSDLAEVELAFCTDMGPCTRGNHDEQRGLYSGSLPHPSLLHFCFCTETRPSDISPLCSVHASMHVLCMFLNCLGPGPPSHEYACVSWKNGWNMYEL